MIKAIMRSEPTPLEPGRFYGVNRSERHIGELILSETHYRPDQQVPPHIHQRAYFGYLVGGSYWEQLGQRAVTCEPLSLVFHPPREVRCGHIFDRGARLFHVELPDSWIERLREHGVVPDAALDHHRGPMVALARASYREFRQPDAASPIVIEGVVLEMLGGLLRTRVASGAGGRGVAHDGVRTRWLARARDIFRARALDAPSLADVAAEVGVAPVRLARGFRRAYGESPGEYVRRERIRAACDRLAAGEVSLATLATELGFFDQSHFTRVFRSQVGITPGVWQRENAPQRKRR
jgi:AraC family transcriptional regulator